MTPGPHFPLGSVTAWCWAPGIGNSSSARASHSRVPGTSWEPYFLETPPVSRLLRGSRWPYGGQSDRRAYANLDISSYSHLKCIVGRVNIHLQQCLLAPLAQLAKGQDSPGSENCQKKSQTLSAHHGCSSLLHQGEWQGLTSPLPLTSCVTLAGLKISLFLRQNQVAPVLTTHPWFLIPPTLTHPGLTFARNVV